MTKDRWKGTMMSFGNYISPEKEEQLRWAKTEINSKVKKILKLAKNINPGNNKEGMKKKAEMIHLIEDFHHQYESLYTLYEDLRGEVKKNVNFGDDDASSSSTSTSDSESESFYSPAGVKSHSLVSSETSKASDSDNQEQEPSDFDDTVLKDKLTSTSEVTKSVNFDSDSTTSVPQEYDVITKDVRIQETEESSQKLSSKMNDLELQVASLKLEIVNLNKQKKQMEDRVEVKSNEAMGFKEKLSLMEAQNLEFEVKLREKEQKFVELITQANNLKLQVNTLRLEKGELELRLSRNVELESELEMKSQEASESLRQIEILRNELESRSSHKERQIEILRKELESRSSHEKGSIDEKERQIEILRNELENCSSHEKGSIDEKEGLKAQIKDLELKIQSLNSNKSELEDQIKTTKKEALESNVVKEELRGKISELKQELKALTNDKKQLYIELEKEKQESMISKSQMEKKISDLNNKNADLTDKITDQQKNLLELAGTMSKLKDENGLAQIKFADSKTGLAIVEKKMDEMAAEFRKQFEDKYRIMSRRIRVAEQLHVENKEWYRKTKAMYEEENKELKDRMEKTEVGLKNIIDLSLTANDMLTSLDTIALKFEECTDNFLNRVSKASCDLKFAKDWAKRKNRALFHVKDDLDCLLAQLDEKESEILVFREKVWKSENRARELETLIKEKEDGNLGLEEEKREAIRQLCVWIDYHRSRSDYYKKMLFDLNSGQKKAA